MKPSERFWKEMDYERVRQDECWGEQEHGGHTWLGILTEEVGEVARAINEGDMEALATELVQVAAVAQSMFEQLFDPYRCSLAPQWGEFSRDVSVEDLREILEAKDLRAMMRRDMPPDDILRQLEGDA